MILREPKGDSLTPAIESALSGYLLTKDSLGKHLESGDFFIVLDGVTDYGLSPQALEAFLRGFGHEDDISARVLLATKKTTDEFRRLVRTYGPSLVVEPRRLNDATLATFVAKYRPGDPTLSEALKAVCRGPDLSYSPILVHLALQAGDDSVDSVAGLYRSAFHRLLRAERSEGEKLLKETAAHCVATYWADGYTFLAFDRLPRSLRETLLAAGILVPINGRDGPGDDNRNGPGDAVDVRFFHDSMLTYLTAFGLFQEADPWPHLFRAAGDPQFSTDRLDLVVAGAPALFQMCLSVFRPINRLRDRLCTTWLAGRRSTEGTSRNAPSYRCCRPTSH